MTNCTASFGIDMPEPSKYATKEDQDIVILEFSYGIDVHPPESLDETTLTGRDIKFVDFHLTVRAIENAPPAYGAMRGGHCR